jgi:beta-glucosidase
VADQSIVLLRNQGNLLPLKNNIKSIAVIGPLADDQNDPLGPWSGHGRGEDVVTVLQGIKAKLSSQTKIRFVRGCGINDSSTDGFKEATKTARESDVVIAVVGEAAGMSGEAASRSFLGLPGVQEQLVQALEATGKPVVVVLMNGRPLAIPWIAEHVPAIVESWFLGVEAGNAIADVLFGDYNPSGKITATFPRTTGQVPCYYNHKHTGRPADDTVKWTSKYIDLPNTPLFPFGYGLSYTTFSYEGLTLSSNTMHPNDSIVVSAIVKNTGSRAGEEIAQLYIHDEVASVTRPVKELKGFEKVALAPGEAKTIRFVLASDQLKFYDLSMSWTVEPGKFKVFVGPNSAEGLETEFEYVNQ